MQFGSITAEAKKEEISEKNYDFNRADVTPKSQNASEMYYSESPQSTTSMEMAEFSIQSNDDKEDSDDALSSDESEVNLPAGSYIYLFC